MYILYTSNFTYLFINPIHLFFVHLLIYVFPVSGSSPGVSNGQVVPVVQCASSSSSPQLAPIDLAQEAGATSSAGSSRQGVQTNGLSPPPSGSGPPEEPLPPG